jgi:hypothetical protein
MDQKVLLDFLLADFYSLQSQLEPTQIGWRIACVSTGMRYSTQTGWLYRED